MLNSFCISKNKYSNSLVSIALLNPIVGTGDIFYTLLLLIKIPENAMVKTDTSKVFWKKIPQYLLDIEGLFFMFIL